MPPMPHCPQDQSPCKLNSQGAPNPVSSEAWLSHPPTPSTHTAEVTPAQPLLQLSQVCAREGEEGNSEGSGLASTNSFLLPKPFSSDPAETASLRGDPDPEGIPACRRRLKGPWKLCSVPVYSSSPRGIWVLGCGEEWRQGRLRICQLQGLDPAQRTPTPE